VLIKSALRLALASVFCLSGVLGVRFAAVAQIEPVQSGEARHAMVVSANPLASEAGMAMLDAGGSAADAAIAIQAVLTLVEPQSSGFGGGAFALHWQESSLLLESYDGRETAPLAADGSLFLQPDGQPMPFLEAVIGGRAVGTPGALRMLELMHQQHGRLPWAKLFAPAIRLAEEGFTVTPRLSASIDKAEGLADEPAARKYFFDADGQPWPAGHTLKNPAYARLLRHIAAKGADAFYKGSFAAELVARVQAHPTNPGVLDDRDLKQYRAVRRAAVCAPFRGYNVCGMGPPSSGGLTVGQILGMLDNFPDMLKETQYAHLFVEASRLAYADRARYMADADFVAVPGKALLDPDYLKARAALMPPHIASMEPAQAGEWPATQLPPSERERAVDPKQKNTGTSHFVIADAAGNIVSMTTSVESAFGSRQLVHGMILNNQLTDFSFTPRDENGLLVANRVEPGKRPRSSMSPSIVFDHNWRPVLAIGSPGGSRIINYVAEAIIEILDMGYSPPAAFALAHIGNRNGVTEVEAGWVGDGMALQLGLRGHEIRRSEMESGLHAILFIRSNDEAVRLIGGADPRREGHVVGR